MKKKIINVAELFAGVGGFRLGLEKSLKNKFYFSFVNQWEPNKKNQFAFKCYEDNFKSSPNHINEDINKVKHLIPDNIDLLVGGFPCQDYSALNPRAKGLAGDKGQLWWVIDEIIKNKKPKFLLFENVERILKMPTNNKGANFIAILKSLDLNGYNVEYMAHNASDYGFPQRRNRIYIFAYKNNLQAQTPLKNAFPFKVITTGKIHDINDFKTIEETIEYWKENGERIYNYGVLVDGVFYNAKTEADYNGSISCLFDITENKPVGFNLTEKQILSMRKYKGAKSFEREKNGYKYTYKQGKMNLTDNIFKPARTIVTSEGSLNRSTHLIKEIEKDIIHSTIRFLTNIECERLNGFPDNWTKSLTKRQRYFTMGNALIVGVITKIANYINFEIEDQ